VSLIESASSHRADGATVRPQTGKPLTFDEIHGNARLLAEEVRGRSGEIEAARRLPADVVQRMRDAGLFRLNMPRLWGGPEMTSMQQNEVIEELSRANASVGWCAMIGSDSGIVSAYLDDDVAREMYPRLDMVQAGWYFPVGKAYRVKGGYRLTGKWRFASGCTHCDWLSAGCVVLTGGAAASGPPDWKILIARPADFELIDTWHTTGLQGSGSLDYRCEDLFVPEECAFSFFDPPRRRGALYARPDTYLRKMPGIPLGIARDAIDTTKALVADKLEFPSRRPYREMVRVQSAIAEAESLHGAARSYLFTSLERQWEKLAAGAELDKDIRAHVWLSRTHAFQSARRVVQLMYDTLGGGAIYSQETPLDRHLRDVNTICQHLVGQTKGWEAVGALLLDTPSATPYPFL
jgi:alkylation response protein AidB-like acyl-CoA dehydrogenase